MTSAADGSGRHDEAWGTAGGFGPALRRWRTGRRLSQLELSLRCGVSQRHLSFLESGRARPSRAMVVQLADALDVPLRERNGLLQAAGFAALYRERGLTERDMAPVRHALEHLLAGHQPYPAVVVDRDYNLLMSNPPFDALLAVLGNVDAAWRTCCGDGPRNLLALTFHAAGMRPYIANFDVVAPLLIARTLREARARGAAPPPAVQALRKDTSLPAHWHAPDPSLAPPPVLSLQLALGDAQLRLFTMISTFGTAADVTADELRLEFFFPEDDASAALLTALAAQAEDGRETAAAVPGGPVAGAPDAGG